MTVPRGQARECEVWSQGRSTAAADDGPVKRICTTTTSVLFKSTVTYLRKYYSSIERKKFTLPKII